MFYPIISSYLFSLFIGVIIIFQLALAFGAPWGEFTMGGKFSGRLPLHMRMSIIVQIALLIFFAVIVLTRVGIVYDAYFELSKSLIWFAVAFSTLALILNTITPSKKERTLWAPVSSIILLCSIDVALS